MELVETVDGGHLVVLRQGGIVEDGVSQGLDGGAGRHHRLADVYEFRRPFPDDVDPQQGEGLGVEDQLQQAGLIARDLGLDYSVSQIVIDEERNATEIDLALVKLETIAQENGVAIGIGSSLPLTIGRIAEWLSALKSKGIELIKEGITTPSEVLRETG